MLYFLRKYRLRLLTASYGIIYLWFGIPKFFAGVSPAEELAKATIDKITFGLFPVHVSYIILACWEVIIGCLMMLNIRNRYVIAAMSIHLACTFLPLVLLHEMCYGKEGFVLSLVGQYIVKNLILFFGLLFLVDQKK